MKTDSLCFGLNALRSTLPAALMFGLTCLTAPAGRGQISIEIYEDGSDLVFHYAGSINSWTEASSFDYSYTGVGANGLYSWVGVIATTSDTLVSGTPLPWQSVSSASATVTGDSFGFSNSVYTYTGYVEGTELEGWLKFPERGLADLGVDLGDSGLVTYASGNSVSWSVGLSAVPEPGTYAAIAGAVGLLGAVIRRRARGPAPTAPALPPAHPGA